MATLINNTRYKSLTGLYGFLLEKFLPAWNGKLVLVHNAQALSHYSTEAVQLLAMLSESPIEGIYMLVISDELSNPDEVAAHEFVHLMQMVSGQLSADYAGHSFIWLGREYKASMPYNERPWEKAAFRLSPKLLKEYRLLFKQKSNEKH